MPAFAASAAPAAVRCSRTYSEFVAWKTVGALMPFPALNVSRVSLQKSFEGAFRYAAIDSRGEYAFSKTSLCA